jgi:hypothetical protein
MPSEAVSVKLHIYLVLQGLADLVALPHGARAEARGSGEVIAERASLIQTSGKSSKCFVGMLVGRFLRGSGRYSIISE